MSDLTTQNFTLPPEQQAIRDTCFHPSGTYVEFSKSELEQSIAQRFEKIASQYPDRLAVKMDDRRLTYEDLNRAANRVAHAILQQCGVSNSNVVLLFSQGVDVIPGILGALKAGKCFVLAELSWPPEHLAAILEDSGASVVVTNRDGIDIASRLVSGSSRWLDVNRMEDSIPANNVRLDLSPDLLGYLIYTSGSTGKPKGVFQNQRNILHGVMRRINGFRIAPDDRLTLLSSGGHQAIMNILSAVLSGSAILPFDAKAHSPSQLVDWLQREGITIYHSSASLFRQLTSVLTGDEDLSSIRLVRSASEATSNRDVELFQKHFAAHCIFSNGMGSTETGTSVLYFMGKHTAIDSESVPIGFPLDDMEIQVVDDDGREVARESLGEIVIKSRYLALGYWRQPELTDAKFKADAQDPAKRIYFTGDLGVMRGDGCLIHKGRKDFRVKIRGYGVELGEVEKVLREHGDTKDAVVVTKETASGESRLVAYLTSQRQSRPSITQIREMLKTRLPEYMIPSSIVLLDDLPLMPNGKVDRRALPDPDSRRPELDTPFVAPRTDMENAIARIVSECTGVEPVGIEDNFFELGGDSLTLARLLSRLTATFEREIPVRDLYESSSVTGFARLLEATALPASPMNETTLGSAAELSFSQQRLWFLDQLQPGDPAYNLLSAFQIIGKLSIGALEQSLNEIIGRHEVLRTVFESVDGLPRFKVLPKSTISIPMIELVQTVSQLENGIVLKQQCAALVRQPFDLRHGPLLRVILLRQSDDRHVLVIVAHHIVFDGWSMGILWDELALCYEAFSQGTQVSLPKLAIQYPDYARWQRNRLQNHLLQEQSEYWRQHLNGTISLQLMNDRPRPVVQSSLGSKQYFSLSVDLSGKLKRLSHDRGTTLFMTLLAAFQTLLHRYTSQDDIAIGCPVAGRNRSEVENLIGFFLNTLVFRVDTSGEPSFLELLDRVRQVCLAAYAHQDMPFEKLVEELCPERHLNRNPFVDVMFAFQNTPHVAPQLSGTSVFQLDIDSGISRFDLQLFMEETTGQLRGYFSYNSDLFHDQTIGRMTENFINLLDGIVADPNQLIGHLTLLSTPERQQIGEWNDTERDYPLDKCVHELFEVQVEKTPDATAVAFEDEQVTYRELNNRANQLAHYLRKVGVGPNVFVGVYVERSLEVIVALLGVLKAGAGYLPLDSSYPEARLEYMLKDSGAPVLLTLDELSQRPAEYGGQTICLDQEWQEIGSESTANLPNEADETDIAYVIYTSGSTGNPKGVTIPHSAICNHMMWMLEAFPLNQDDRVAQRTPLSFDASVWEFFAPLICGAQLVLASAEDSRDAGCLINFLQKQRITILQVVPTLLQMLLEENLAPCTSLRRVFCGGEPLSTELYARFRRQLAVPLINLYGPTEAAIDTTSYVCSEGHSRGWMPIGRPIANAEIYILDVYGNPVPIGVIGEIYIGGDGVARGYLNRPELTAEKFVYHSFDGEPARRLYRSGDLGRYLPDGNIEFIGRVDNQVKIRGYRIEAGEVETVLSQHRSVQSSVVVVREDAPGDKRLVGYVVTQPGESFDSAEMKKHLKQKLPEYMIPSALVLLDQLPLTPSGKVDQNALPAPDQNRTELGNVYQAPRTSIEGTLAAIWGEVLKLDQIGIHDNFFDLGGHSLLATQVVSRIRKCLSMELPLRTLFEAPTIEQLVAAIKKHREKQSEEPNLEHVLFELESPPAESAQRLLNKESTSTSEGDRHE